MNNVLIQYLPPALATISLLASFLLPFIERYKTKRSIRETIEGDNLFNADQVLNILKEFSDEEKRLKALETLTNHDTNKAKQVLNKIKSNVDLNKIEKDDQKNYSLTLLVTSVVFFALSLAVFYFYPLDNQKIVDPPPNSPVTPECSGKPIKDLPFNCLIEREKAK